MGGICGAKVGKFTIHHSPFIIHHSSFVARAKSLRKLRYLAATVCCMHRHQPHGLASPILDNLGCARPSVSKLPTALTGTKIHHSPFTIHHSPFVIHHFGASAPAPSGTGSPPRRRPGTGGSASPRTRAGGAGWGSSRCAGDT